VRNHAASAQQTFSRAANTRTLQAFVVLARWLQPPMKGNAMAKQRASRRVVFSLAILLAALAPFSAHAQQPEKLPRVGFLSLSDNNPQGDVPQWIAKALHDLGYVDGKSAVFEYRFAHWQSERLPELAAELVQRKVDVIVAITNLPGFAARGATRSVPIVVWGIHGAVQTGLVQSLARPGGNVTGMETLAPELDAKRLELIKELVPSLARLGVLYNADDQGAPVHLAATRDAGRVLGVGLVQLEARRPADFETVLSPAAAKQIDGLLMFTDDLTASHWRTVVEFAHRNRLPTVCELRFLVELGCLVSYGPSTSEFTQAASRQVDKILKGANPADIPVEQSTRFELLVNEKTARSLGITIPHSVLVRVDEVVR
jgi:putative ABC transport system substrate-binding protein